MRRQTISSTKKQEDALFFCAGSTEEIQEICFAGV